jgi:hypothetical protein
VGNTIVWTVIVLVIQVFLPWVVAKIGPRLGWSQQGDPGWWNLAGLIVVSEIYTTIKDKHHESRTISP